MEKRNWCNMCDNYETINCKDCRIQEPTKFTRITIPQEVENKKRMDEIIAYVVKKLTA